MFLVWIEFRKDGDELKELELIVIILIGYDFVDQLDNFQFDPSLIDPCIIWNRHFDPSLIPMYWSLGIAWIYADSFRTGLVVRGKLFYTKTDKKCDFTWVQIS